MLTGNISRFLMVACYTGFVWLTVTLVYHAPVLFCRSDQHWMLASRN